MSDKPRRRTGQAVTSWAQDEVWLLDQLSTQPVAHQICRAYEVTGRLAVEGLRAAWRAVLNRHDILRTTLATVDGSPMQRVAAEVPESFALVDLSRSPPADRRERADRLCAALAAEPVSLAKGPLARLTVVRLTATAYRVILMLHRVVADEGSVSILIRELSAGYARALGGRGPGAGPDLPAQYADYARWQRAQEATGTFRRHRDWWVSTLRPPPPPLTLPVDRSRSAQPVVSGRELRYDWGGDAARLVASLAREAGSSTQAVVFAALQCLLYRYGNRERVPVCVPVALRPPGFAELIGPFDTLLVLCADIAGSSTFRQQVEHATQLIGAALDHRMLPLHHLVRELDVDREPGRPPLCGARFVFRKELESELDLPGAKASRYEVELISAVSDLTFTVERSVPSLAGRLQYRSDLFDLDTATVVLDQLHTLLVGGLNSPDAVLDALPVEGPDRVAIATADPCGKAPAAPVPELVCRRARQAQAAGAVAGSGPPVSYGELERASALVAGRLHALGVAGSAVAIRMPPGPRQVAASLGVLRAGAQLVWFGTGDAGERGRTVLTELRPACLLWEGAMDGLATWYRDELGGQVIDVAALESAEAAPLAGSRAELDQVAYVAYTSGSTGKPKGVAQSHAAFAQFVTWMAETFDLGPGARLAQWVAPEHDPSLCEVFATLAAGGTLCPVPSRIRVHPEKLVAWLAEQRITFLQTVPSFARELLKVVIDRESARLDTLRHLVLMGEALPADLANGLRRALPAVHLANVYGPTETIAATWHEITEDVTGTVPIGHPIPGRQVLVLDSAGRACPTGVTGEIVVRSPYVAAGYVGDSHGGGAFRPVPGLADGDAVSNRYYWTGDLARRRSDGRLEFRGRKDSQVKLYGTRLELADVEAALAEHDSVAECAVVPLVDQDGLVVRLVAYVVPRRSRAGRAMAGASAWRAHLRRLFGTSVQLVSFETLSGRLPRNVGGKVDRRRLPAVPARLTTATSPSHAWVERALAGIWSDLLGGRRISSDDGFFAVGGHSLLIPQLVNRIRERFGVEIPPGECISHHTLSGMSALVRSAGARDDAASPPDPADVRAAA